MSQDTTIVAASGGERPRTSQSVANPRRLRLDHAGRPLPVTSRDEDCRPA
ncbi:hypothetical protein [Angustibacter luteus]|uniref:Uncharacterized protein n=1 Tax=Angustibacter luteus TaxID=658456 RepID=A0ABW1JAD1_9ACTN